MILPKRLQKGDTVGVIAPASPPEETLLVKGISVLEKLGLTVRVGRNTTKKYGYLAGTDEERRMDFHEMIARKEVKAIIFARGGYGTARIASLLNYPLIANNPKIIWGYSDITYLHTAIRQRTGLVTFHGPMVVSIGKRTANPLSINMFKQLFHPTELLYSEKISPLTVYSHGETSGKIVGGNLSLMARSLGTPYEIDTRGKIILLEDIGEEPYKVDAMLNQLKLAGKFSEVKGIIIGDFAQSEPKEQPSLTLDDVWEHYFSNVSIPVMAGFKIGHCEPNFSLPLGVPAHLSTYYKTLIISPAVQ